MEYKTYSELKTIVDQELDLEQEVFIQSAEMMEYFNQAINEAEAMILKLGLEDDYFLTKDYLPLVTGEADVELPSSIYASKIRKIIYRSGSTVYEIKRMRNRTKFLDKTLIDIENSSNPIYVYILRNDAPPDDPDDGTGLVLELAPSSKETSSTNVTCWYIRNATRMEDDDSRCDIPEFYSFILAFVRYKILDKEGHPGADTAKADLELQRTLMVDTLDNMVPDEESEIEQDLSHYEDMS